MELTEFTNVALMDIRVRPVEQCEEAQYPGSLAKIGETVWYVAIWREQWVAQLNLSAAALLCGVRDRVRDHTFVINLDRLGLSLAVWPVERKRSLHHRLEPAMRIAAKSAPASAPKTSAVCAALPSASSKFDPPVTRRLRTNVRWSYDLYVLKRDQAFRHHCLELWQHHAQPGRVVNSSDYDRPVV